MTPRPNPDAGTPAGLLALIFLQAGCAMFFAWDVASDFLEAGQHAGQGLHLAVEAAATASLIVAILIELRLLRRLLARKAQLEHSLSMASAEIHDVILAHFEAWNLSPSETDVATFLVKGLSTAEIAAARGTTEGTVKAQLNAIYRKAGVRNRTELLSTVLDGLVTDRPADGGRGAGARTAPPVQPA